MSENTIVTAKPTPGVTAARRPRIAGSLAFWLVVAGLALAGPFLDDPYIRHVLILCFLWAIVVAAWDLVLGYAGIFNYAQLVFFAFGAYGAGILSARHGMPPIVAIPLGGLIAAGIGSLMALPCLRLRGEYIALFTFAIHLALPPLILKAKPWGTGGTLGLLGIPPVEIFGLSIGPLDKQAWYFLTLIIAAAAIYVIYFVVLRSRMGRAFVALRDSPEFASSLGVSEFRYKLLAFTVSALVTGIAGALYAHYTTVVTPKILGNEFFLLAMVMLAIGGIGRYPGAILGAFLVTISNELLRSAGNFRLLLLGLAVVLTILLLPRGIVSLREQLSRFWPKAKVTK